tara:strand:+ start:546 stop:779 length:234 start_codon:yes stop_codon:yes gene_type:complete
MNNLESTKGGIRHGFSKAIYLPFNENCVKIVGADGREGIFDAVGRWIEGELFEADPQMCVWISANRIETSHRLSKQE